MIGYLLDSNVPSEATKRNPEPKVGSWLAAQRAEELFLSSISVGEFRKGIMLVPEGRRRAELSQWLDSLTLSFSDRILPVTANVGNCWGRLEGLRQLAGRPIHTPDALIAATAIEHGLTLVTRNVRDFEGLGIQLLNPWEL